MAEPVRPLRNEPEVNEPATMGRRYDTAPMTEPYAIAQPRDLVRWGPIFAGFVASVAVSLFLILLGVGLGLTAADGADAAPGLTQGTGIWGGISLLVALFIGGWVAARTAMPSGQSAAMMHGAVVWAFWLFFLFLLSVIGAAAVVPVIAGPGAAFGGVLGPTGLAEVAGGVWTAVLFLLLALAAAVVGGFLGKHEPGENVNYYR